MIVKTTWGAGVSLLLILLGSGQAFVPIAWYSRPPFHSDSSVNMPTQPTGALERAAVSRRGGNDSPSARDPVELPIPQNSKNSMTLTRFLDNMVQAQPDLLELQNMLLALELSCKTISNMVHRSGLINSVSSMSIQAPEGLADGRYYSMKRLNALSTSVLKNALIFTGTVQMLPPYAKKPTQPYDPLNSTATSFELPEKANPHEPGVLVVYDDNFVSCLDPLDGSGNADASISTGTVFGVYPRDKSNDNVPITSTSNLTSTPKSKSKSKSNSFPPGFGAPAVHRERDVLQSVLQPGRNMKAAGYCLYSSSTVLVLSIAGFTAKLSGSDAASDGTSGIFGFTLDPQLEEFVLTHHPWNIPQRGTVYSCNEANSEGWDKNGPWWKYLERLKLGTGESKTRYSHRYVGSMVGDMHRTLLYGGMFAYPGERLEKPHGNLQLVYKSAPMAFLATQAGGGSIDDKGSDLLDFAPTWLHQRVPCFMGSSEDVEELRTFFLAAEEEKAKKE